MQICVFSSSSNAIDQVYFNEAEILGSLIGQKKHDLINGGANVGLMEAITVAAKKAGAKTLGVIPERMKNKNLVSENLNTLITTKNMQQRKAKMREISDAFIALPGGFGTIEEILEVITLKQLDYHNKAITFINTNHFFDNLFKLFDQFYNQFFAKEHYKKLYYIANDANDAINYIESYKPELFDNKWFKVLS